MLLTNIRETVQFEITDIPSVKNFIGTNTKFAKGILENFGMFPVFILLLIVLILLLKGLK